MKYIKLFESFKSVDDLHELCQLQLVELSDLGCQFRITESSYNQTIVGDDPHKIFSMITRKYNKWSELKDILLTFIESILFNYNIDNFNIWYRDSNKSNSLIIEGSSKFKIDDLSIIDDNWEISNISFDFF